MANFVINYLFPLVPGDLSGTAAQVSEEFGDLCTFKREIERERETCESVL